MMQKLFNLLKQNKTATSTPQKKSSKKKWIIGGAGLLGGGYITSRFLGDKTEQELAISQPVLTNNTEIQKSAKKQVGAVSNTLPTQEVKQEENVVGAFIPELIKLYQLSNALAIQYEQDAETFYQIYQAYEKKLEELLPVMVVEMMKTPLSQITGEDLPSKILTLFKYYSWEFAVENFPKILKGYYLIKIHDRNQKTENLTINDLIAVADNPALAQNENIVKLLEMIGEQYKLKMQNALGMIGKLKDVYSYKLNVLKEQANLIKEMIKAILDQETLNFEKQYKLASLQQKERHFNEMMRWRWAQHNLARQKLEQQSLTAPLIKIED